MAKSQRLLKGDYSWMQFHQRNHTTPARMCTGIQSRRVCWHGVDCLHWMVLTQESGLLLSVATQGVRNYENHGPIWPWALEATLGRSPVCTHQAPSSASQDHRTSWLGMNPQGPILVLHWTPPEPPQECSRYTSPPQYTPGTRTRAQQWI